MKSKNSSIMGVVLIAMAFAFTSSSAVAIGGPCSECTGGPKTHEWTGWKNIRMVGGVKLQARYFMERKRFGTRTVSNVQYRYCNHTGRDVVVTTDHIVFKTVSGLEFAMPMDSVTVPAGGAVAGQVYTITTVGNDKICTHGESVRVR